jgi:hypothetical protein
MVPVLPSHLLAVQQRHRVEDAVAPPSRSLAHLAAALLGPF